MKQSHLHCPLCHTQQTSHFHNSENRQYHHCHQCDLVFVPEVYFVSTQEEKAKYDHHQNSLQNEGYVAFLNRLLVPLESYLAPGAKGLDFGSGPGPTLHLLMRSRGYSMDIYCYFYAPDCSVFSKRYNFITATEVVEHLHKPREELQRLWEMLCPGGVLGIMTAFRPEDFTNWYYKRDLTHIHFFTPKTFAWIAAFLEAKLHIPQSGVVILQKPKSP